MKSQNNHWHYKICAYNKLNQKNKNYEDFAHISVVAYSEKEAIRKIKPLIVKNFYRVSEIWECLETHGLQTEMQMAQLEIQKKTLDAMKGMNHG